MSISPLTPTPPATASARPAAPSSARAADGDFKTAGRGHTVKDADGDYKPTGAPSSAAATSSGAVLAAVTNLKKGG